MSLLGGIMKSVVNPMTLAQVAMGPAGWASIGARMIMSAVGQQAIQALGAKLGLPQAAIDTAQGAFCTAMGDRAGAASNLREAQAGLTGQFNLSPREAGDAMRQMQDTLNNFVSKLSESDDFKAAKAGGKSGGGWLMALASVLGDKLNVKAKEVTDLAGQITGETPDKTAKFGAASQEFGILMNATNNAIKSIGEGLTTTARKG